MKLQIFLSLSLMLVGIPHISAVCLPNSMCVKERDRIIQQNSEIMPSERTVNGARTWYIKPSELPFNAVLAFKNFSSLHTSVLVISYKEERKSIEYFYGNLTDFELVYPDSVGIIIYATINSEHSANFELNYYTGCEILSSASGQIISVPSHLAGEKRTTCWFIHPVDNNDRKRIYFGLRGVSLKSRQRLALWDIHSMKVIMEAKDGSRHELLAVETQEQQSIVVDLICTGDDCSNGRSSFVMSYYAMTEEDITCIGVQRLCDERDNVPLLQCDVTCPAFENMAMEEFGYEITGSFLRSGEVADDDTHTTENNDLVTRKESKKTKPTRRRRCPLPKPLCNCKRMVKKHSFCAPNVDCFGLGQCTFACIFHKLTTCIRINILNSLKLL